MGIFGCFVVLVCFWDLVMGRVWVCGCKSVRAVVVRGWVEEWWEVSERIYEEVCWSWDLEEGRGVLQSM